MKEKEAIQQLRDAADRLEFEAQFLREYAGKLSAKKLSADSLAALVATINRCVNGLVKKIALTVHQTR